MKKVLLSVVMVLMLSVFTGCNGKTSKFVVDEIETNTIYIKEDHTVNAATVEVFNEEYYQLDELKDFVQTQVDDYNNSSQLDGIHLKELLLKDDNAVLVLNYTSPQVYSQFNESNIIMLESNEIASYDGKLPSAFIQVKDGAYMESDLIFSKDEYTMALVDESADVMVDGKILFYENGTMIKDNHIKTNGDGMSYIIYKAK